MTATVRILAVDDDPRLRHLISTHLRQRAWDCVLAEDGPTALARAAEGGFDLILCDVVLPGIDGISIAKDFNRLCPGVPVVYMTGNASADTAMRALRNGAADFLPKPFHLRALDEALDKALARRVRPASTEQESWETPEEAAIRRSMSTLAKVVGQDGPQVAGADVDPGLVALVDALCRKLDAPADDARIARWAARLSLVDSDTLSAIEAAGEAARLVRERGASWAHGAGRTTDGRPLPLGLRCLDVATRALDAVDASRFRPADEARAALRIASGTDLDPQVVSACAALPDSVFDALARRSRVCGRTPEIPALPDGV